MNRSLRSASKYLWFSRWVVGKRMKPNSTISEHPLQNSLVLSSWPGIIPINGSKYLEVFQCGPPQDVAVPPVSKNCFRMITAPSLQTEKKHLQKKSTNVTFQQWYSNHPPPQILTQHLLTNKDNLTRILSATHPSEHLKFSPQQLADKRRHLLSASLN